MRKALRALAFAALFVPLRLWAETVASNKVAAEAASSEYVVSAWRIQNGLPSDRVRSVIQTREGYIWVATFNGIARFDGVRFDRFNDANTPELRNSLANSLFEDTSNRLWVGSDTGEITWRDADGFHPLDMPANWPSSPVDQFAEAADGTLYALNRNGLLLMITNCHCAGMIGAMPANLYSAVVSDQDGQVWAVHYGGSVVRISNRKEIPDGPPPVPRTYRNVAGARQGGIWVRDGSQLRRWHNGQWVEDRGTHSWTTQRGVVLEENADGEIWVGTVNEGAFIVAKDGSEAHVNRASGLGSELVSCIITDAEGNTWVATDGGGLNLLRHRVLTMVNPPDHWQDRAVLSVAPAIPEGLWVGTEGAGVYRLKDGRFSSIRGPENPVARDVRAVWQARTGELWAGTQGYGLLWSSTNGELIPPKTSGLRPTLRLFYAIYEDRDGALWMGTQNGLVKYQDGRWSRLGNDLYLSEVRCITQAPDGAIWAGLRGGGIARFQDGRVSQLRSPQGLSYDIIWCICADSDGTIWMGTPGAGLIRWRNGRFNSFTTRDGLPSDFVCNIQTDKSGHLWIGSYAGIFLIEKSSLELRAGGSDEPLSYTLLDISDGLTSLEIAGGNQPSACATADGRLWYATSAGLAVVDPSRIRVNRRAPPVHIQEVVVDGKPVPLAKSHASVGTKQPALAIPPGGGPIEIRYTALSFSKPQRCRFRYRLDKVDADWVDAGERRSAYYSKLPPREYLFQVIACNNDGVWNHEGAVITFTVMPYFWERWWFGPLCWISGLSLGLAVILALVRQRHLRRLEALQRARIIERERVRIARDLHDDLGSGLTDINMTSAMGEDPNLSLAEAREYFKEVKECSNEMVNALDEIVWAVNPKNDDLNSLTTYFCQFAERFLKAARISCRFQIPSHLPATPLNAEQRHNLFLAFKESLQNAVKHAGASSISLRVACEAGMVRLEVKDDGCGFVETLPKAGADGLRNMRERLEQIGGECQIISAPGQGTSVVFVLPSTPKKGRQHL